MKTDCDILIVGGGPAGGLAAMLLARAGFAVTLLESQAVLGERVCGAYLCPSGVALLEELQLRAELTHGMRSLEGMVLIAPDERQLQTRFPTGSRYPDYGISLLRPEFDTALLKAAARAGASIQMGRRAQGARRTENGWRVELAEGAGIECRLLIGADGRKSRVAKWLGLSARPWQERVALHVDVPSLKDTEPYGEMHVFNDGSYIGLNPIGLRTWNISALCGPRDVQRLAALEFINQRIASSSHLRTRMAPLTDSTRVRATFPAAANVRDVMVPHAALIGDASGFIDPLTGEGIYQALWTARVLANEVLKGWNSDLGLQAALQTYSRRRRRQHQGKRLCSRAFQGIICRPRLSNAVHRLLSLRQGVGDAFIGLIGNNYTPAQAVWNMLKALPG